MCWIVFYNGPTLTQQWPLPRVCQEQVRSSWTRSCTQRGIIMSESDCSLGEVCMFFINYIPSHNNVRIWLFFWWSVHVFLTIHTGILMSESDCSLCEVCMFLNYSHRHFNVRIWLFFVWSVHVFLTIYPGITMSEFDCFLGEVCMFFNYLPRHNNVRIGLFFGWSVHVVLLST